MTWSTYLNNGFQLEMEFTFVRPTWFVTFAFFLRIIPAYNVSWFRQPMTTIHKYICTMHIPLPQLYIAYIIYVSLLCVCLCGINVEGDNFVVNEVEAMFGSHPASNIASWPPYYYVWWRNFYVYMYINVTMILHTLTFIHIQTIRWLKPYW